MHHAHNLCRQLTSEQYITVCTKLITKFPKLRDRIGSNGYVSSKTNLHDRNYCYYYYLGILEARAANLL